ncbi:MAG: hypothetical protein JSV12_06690 [Candidatus Bathyarchaeota archaeon]|nr:MAG: hypothetical protein JSV12_06690 [Candidatus Bathyarchaeota archaeon]
MKRGLLVLMVICGFTLGVGLSFTVHLTRYSIENIAAVKMVGVSVWQDVNLTTPLTQLDWGFIEPGENVTITCYVRNEGNIPETLGLLTENWTPANASDWINLSWNLEGVTIDFGEALTGNFTLTVSSSITSVIKFSFDTVIVGSG